MDRIINRVAAKWYDTKFYIKLSDKDKEQRHLRTLLTDLQEMLDRYRGNEGVHTRLERIDSDGVSTFDVGISGHDGVEGMIRKLQQIVERHSRRKKLELVRHSG